MSSKHTKQNEYVKNSNSKKRKSAGAQIGEFAGNLVWDIIIGLGGAVLSIFNTVWKAMRKRSTTKPKPTEEISVAQLHTLLSHIPTKSLIEYMKIRLLAEKEEDDKKKADEEAEQAEKDKRDALLKALKDHK